MAARPSPRWGAYAEIHGSRLSCSCLSSQAPSCLCSAIGSRALAAIVTIDVTVATASAAVVVAVVNDRDSGAWLASSDPS